MADEQLCRMIMKAADVYRWQRLRWSDINDARAELERLVRSASSADAILRELVQADKAWKDLHPIHRIHEMEKGETRLQAAWKAAQAHVSGVGGTDAI